MNPKKDSRDISFATSSKLGFELDKDSCRIKKCKNGGQAYWAGVQNGWTITHVEKMAVDPTNVKAMLKGVYTNAKAVKGKRKVKKTGSEKKQFWITFSTGSPLGNRILASLADAPANKTMRLSAAATELSRRSLAVKAAGGCCQPAKEEPLKPGKATTSPEMEVLYSPKKVSLNNLPPAEQKDVEVLYSPTGVRQFLNENPTTEPEKEPTPPTVAVDEVPETVTEATSPIVVLPEVIEEHSRHRQSTATDNRKNAVEDPTRLSPRKLPDPIKDSNDDLSPKKSVSAPTGRLVKSGLLSPSAVGGRSPNRPPQSHPNIMSPFGSKTPAASSTMFDSVATILDHGLPGSMVFNASPAGSADFTPEVGELDRAGTILMHDQSTASLFGNDGLHILSPVASGPVSPNDGDKWQGDRDTQRSTMRDTLRDPSKLSSSGLPALMSPYKYKTAELQQAQAEGRILPKEPNLSESESESTDPEEVEKKLDEQLGLAKKEPTPPPPADEHIIVTQWNTAAMI